MDSSADRMEKMYSCTSPRFRLVDSAACKKDSRYSLTWSKARKAGRQRTSSPCKPLSKKICLGRPAGRPFYFPASDSEDSQSCPTITAGVLMEQFPCYDPTLDCATPK